MKKRNLFIILVLVLFVGVSKVSAANISACNSILPNAIIDEKIPNTVSLIVTIIKIAVPVLLVIFGMLDLMKGIMQQKEDEIKKGQQLFIKRIIAGVLVFFVFSVVQFIIGLVADSSNRRGIMDCVQCFINNKCEVESEESNGDIINSENETIE